MPRLFCHVLLHLSMSGQNKRCNAYAGDKFALTDDQDGGGELLTHMGRTLGADDTNQVCSHAPAASLQCLPQWVRYPGQLSQSHTQAC